MSTTPHVYTLEDLRHWDNAAGHVRPPIRLAVIGDPISHSASPQMQMAALRECGLNASYVRLHIRPDELREAMSLLQTNGFIGANLTIPHKASVIPLLHNVDSNARTLGVVNTVAIRNGILHGHNTDGGGLSRAIQADFDIPLGTQRVLILGAGGGAGRAIAIQCAMEGCPLLILVNRTIEKAQTLAAEIQDIQEALNTPTRSTVSAVANTRDSLGACTENINLIIQCTSLGMKEGDPSPFPAELLSKNLFVYDTIYSRRTELLRNAESAGARTANGLSMLLHQGALAFEIWFPNKTAPVSLMRAALQAATSTPPK